MLFLVLVLSSYEVKSLLLCGEKHFLKKVVIGFVNKSLQTVDGSNTLGLYYTV